MHAVLTPALVTSLLLFGGRASLAQEGSAAHPAEDRLAAARTRLAAVGYDVPADVTAAERTAAEVLADVTAQQEVLFPPGGYDVQFALLQALRLRPGRDAAALRQRTVAGMVRGLAAYYDPIRRAFVLLPSASREVSKELGGEDALVVHELVHACQDARDGGLRGLFAASTASIDEILARRCLIEGEAEVVAAWALRGADAVALLAAGTTDGGLGRLFAGELTGEIYEAGRRLAAASFAAAGREGLIEAWSKPPSSTEQALHPQKLGKDLPRRVAVPAVPGTEVVAQSTLGELLVRDLARQMGQDSLTALCTAAGWDGDTFVVVKADGEADPETGCLWRSVWDREEDAEAFAALLQTRRGSVVRRGCCVDWAWSGDAALQERLTAALAGDALEGPTVADDVASTAAVESAARQEAGKQAVRGERWEHGSLGLTVPVPKGFELREVRGVKVLVDKEAVGRGFANNVNVQAVPRGAIADFEQFLQQNRDQLAAMPSLTVVRLEPGERSGQPVIEAELYGRFGRSPELHCLVVSFLRADQAVTVTMTYAKGDWAANEAEARRVMQGIEISPP